MPNHHDDATSWRDLADQVTAEQRDWLEAFEAQAGAQSEGVAEHLLETARGMATNNLVDAVDFGHIARPAGATRVGPWEQSDGNWSRHFDGTRRNVCGVHVSIVGTQRADGTIERTVVVETFDGVELTVVELRDLLAAGAAAADEIERLP